MHAVLLQLAVAATALAIDPADFQVVQQSSGPVSYYQVRSGPEGRMLSASYQWPLETVVLGFAAPDEFRRSLSALRWRWRVARFPPGADDCRPEVGDAAAGVFATFRAGLKWYVIKYVWNSGGAAGRSCVLADGIFFAKRVVVLRAGGETEAWAEERVDPRADFARLFGRPIEQVPDFVGIGVLTDGDAVRAASAGDYAGFQLIR